MVLLRLSACCGLLFLAGCGSSTAPLVPVQGQVHYRGRPLPGGTIVFTPDAQRGGRGPQCWARIERDGSFTLSTDVQGGVAPGWYRLTVAGCPEMNLPGQYLDPGTSGLSVHVQAKEQKTWLLELQ